MNAKRGERGILELLAFGELKFASDEGEICSIAVACRRASEWGDDDQEESNYMSRLKTP